MRLIPPPPSGLRPPLKSRKKGSFLASARWAANKLPGMDVINGENRSSTSGIGKWKSAFSTNPFAECGATTATWRPICLAATTISSARVKSRSPAVITKVGVPFAFAKYCKWDHSSTSCRVRNRLTLPGPLRQRK